MKPAAPYETPMKKIDFKFIFYAVATVSILASAIIAVATIRSDAERRESEARKFEERWLREAYHVADANKKMTDLERRVASAESNRAELIKELRRYELEARLLPRIGEKVTVTGVVKYSKSGAYVDVAEFESAIYIRPSKSSEGYNDARIVEKYVGKPLRISGTLHFASQSDDASNLVRRGTFFLDPTEAKFDVLDR